MAVYSSVSDHHACSLSGSARGGLMITNGGCRDCTRLVCVYKSYVCFVRRYISLSRMLSSSRTYAPMFSYLCPLSLLASEEVQSRRFTKWYMYSVPKPVN